MKFRTGGIRILINLCVTHSKFAPCLFHITCCFLALYFYICCSICLEVHSDVVLELFIHLSKLWSGDIFSFLSLLGSCLPLALLLCVWSHMYHMNICLGKWFSPQLGNTFLEVRGLTRFIFVSVVSSTAPDTIQTLRTIYWSELCEMFLALVDSIKASCFAFLSWSLIIQFTLTCHMRRKKYLVKLKNQVMLFLFTNLAWKGVF